MAVESKKSKQSAKSVCVICGKDEFLVANQCELLLDELLTAEQRPMCLYQPKAEEAVLADVLDELRTLPFLAERRVVLIKEAGKFISANRESLEKYFENPSPTGVLIMTVGMWDKRTKLARKLPKVGRLINVSGITRGRLPRYVADYARREHSKDFGKGAAQLLVELTGDEPGRLCSEADKLAMYVGEQKSINADDVEKLIGHNRMFNAFAVIDAVTDCNVGAAVERLRNMFATDRQAEFRVVGAFCYHFRRLFKAKTLLDKGAGRNKIASQLGIWSNQDAFFGQLTKVTLEKIGAVLAELARIDYLVKTGQTDVKVAMEQLVLRLGSTFEKTGT